MKIVYYIDKKKTEYYHMLLMASHSAKVHMPEIETVLLCHSDVMEYYKGMPHVDSIISFYNMLTPYANTRCMANRLLGHEPCLFIDIDTLFVRSVTHFLKELVRTVNTVIATIRWPKSHREDLKYNFGVTFANCPMFWEACCLGYEEANKRKQHPDDGELVPNQVFNQFVKQSFCNMQVRDGEFYNHIVSSPTQDINKAFILHFKGDRKKFMAGFYKKLGYDVVAGL